MDLRHASALAIGAVKREIETSAARHMAEMLEHAKHWEKEHNPENLGKRLFAEDAAFWNYALAAQEGLLRSNQLAPGLNQVNSGAGFQGMNPSLNASPMSMWHAPV